MVNKNLISLIMKSAFILLIQFVVVLFATSIFAQKPELPKNISVLELDSLKGEVKVYYSKGFAKRAAYYQELAESASRFFQSPEILGINVDLHLAVLDAEDWTKYTKFPYGVFHIQLVPPMAILAASKDNVLVRGFLAKKDQISEVTSNFLDEMYFSYDNAATTFADLIGFHEIGHIYSHYYGIWPKEKWLSEFVATYLAYAYMKENQPKLAKLWNVMMAHNIVSTQAKHTTLADFEELYIRVGNDNYGWYQAKFQQKVKEIYEKSGISFVHALKKSLAENPEPMKNDSFRLKELDIIYSGFSTWAKDQYGNLR